MSEVSPFNPQIEVKGLTKRPQRILDKYIGDIPTLHNLIAPQKISNTVVSEAAQEIEILNVEDIGQLTTGIFSIIGTEKPIGEADQEEQNYREGALELLKLVNFRNANKHHLLEAYSSQVNKTPNYAEPYGSIYSLLEAGSIIAPYLPDRRYAARILIDAWNKVIGTSLMSLSIRTRHETFEELRGKLNTIIASLPVSPTQLTQQPIAVPVETRPATEKPKPKVQSPKPQQEKPVEEDASLKIFKEVRRGVRSYEITPELLPWFKESVKVPLDHALLKHNGNAGLYLGVCIARGDPADVAEKMGEDYRRKAFSTFYTALPRWVTEHTSDKVKTLTNQRSKGRIQYTSNPSGQRLYFIEIDRIDNDPVIIVIGMCDKAQQIPLLRAFTTTSIKDLKKIGKI